MLSGQMKSGVLCIMLVERLASGVQMPIIGVFAFLAYSYERNSCKMRLASCRIHAKLK